MQNYPDSFQVSCDAPAHAYGAIENRQRSCICSSISSFFIFIFINEAIVLYIECYTDHYRGVMGVTRGIFNAIIGMRKYLPAPAGHPIDAILDHIL